MFFELKINKPAPNFKLEGILHNQVHTWLLSELKNCWLILCFYEGDFSQASEKTMLLLREYAVKLQEQPIQLLACSTDSVLSHQGWLKQLGQLNFPLLSDIHHATAIDYGVFVEDTANCLFGTFLIDPKGILKFYQVTADPIHPKTLDIIWDVIQSKTIIS